MGGYRKRNKQFIGWIGPKRRRAADEHFRRALLGLPEKECGQSTVEYAVVMAAGLGIVVALGALANLAGDGLFVEHAVSSASHNISGALGNIADVFSY